MSRAVAERDTFCLLNLFSKNLRKIKIKSTLDLLIITEMEF